MILSTGVMDADLAPIRNERETAAASPASAPEVTRVITPLNSLIRPQPWVNWLVVAAGFTCLAGIVNWGLAIDRSSNGLQEVLGLRAGRLCRLFAATCLLAVTQLSLIILWYRTHSRKDFQGQYRIWIWSSLTWGLCFSAAVSGWQVACAQGIVARLPGLQSGLVALVWMIPAAIAVGTTCRLLSREMRRMPAQRWMLRLAMLTACGDAILALAPDLLPSECGPEVANIAGATWPLLVASALLHHARYVIHVSNEVVPHSSRPGRVSPVIQQVWAEVLSLGPSRATLARTMTSGRIGRLLQGAAKRLMGCGVAVGEWLLRLVRRQARGATRETNRGTRRPNGKSLPVASTAGDSRTAASAKGTAKTVKSA